MKKKCLGKERKKPMGKKEKGNSHKEGKVGLILMLQK